MKNKNVALFRETLYEKVWEGEYFADSRTLDESSILSFAFETAALNVPLKYSVMPDSVVEENICKLEEEIEAREEFMGVFAHELKTPLTAIIGYADMLRSHKLDEEKSIMSANYIYTEGKRLEAMSFRLLDIIVAKQDEAHLQETPVGELFEYLREMFAEKKETDIRFVHEEAVVQMETNLIKTVLVNLIDNACKASEPAGVVEVTGQMARNGYRIAVRDYGIGIPETEQSKIVKAFYMVDKSRARSRNGAGLGLALCAEILKIHHSELQIESKVGEGSYAFVVNRRGPSGREITDEQIYATCNEGLQMLKEKGILPEQVREADASSYDVTLYSAIDVLELRNNVAVWKMSLSNSQKNADKANHLIDAYIDADDGKIYEFYVRTPFLWEDIDADALVADWADYMGLGEPSPYELDNPLLETTPCFRKYVFPGMGSGQTVVTLEFYEGINELFLKVSR